MKKNYPNPFPNLLNEKNQKKTLMTLMGVWIGFFYLISNQPLI